MRWCHRHLVERKKNQLEIRSRSIKVISFPFWLHFFFIRSPKMGRWMINEKRRIFFSCACDYLSIHRSQTMKIIIETDLEMSFVDEFSENVYQRPPFFPAPNSALTVVVVAGKIGRNQWKFDSDQFSQVIFHMVFSLQRRIKIENHSHARSR